MNALFRHLFERMGRRRSAIARILYGLLFSILVAGSVLHTCSRILGHSGIMRMVAGTTGAPARKLPRRTVSTGAAGYRRAGRPAPRFEQKVLRAIQTGRSPDGTEAQH